MNHSQDEISESSYQAEVTCERPDIALVKNPTDPDSPEVKLVLGVESPPNKTAEECSQPEEDTDTTPPQQERPPPTRPLPRLGRPACVPSTVARCFCTVDILYD